MQPHLSAIWHALRGELLAPAAPGLLPTDLTSTQQVRFRNVWMCSNAHQSKAHHYPLVTQLLLSQRGTALVLLLVSHLLTSGHWSFTPCVWQTPENVISTSHLPLTLLSSTLPQAGIPLFPALPSSTLPHEGRPQFPAFALSAELLIP